METSNKENIYMTLISKCHEEVEQINKRTEIIRSPSESLKVDGTPTRTSLERELQGLLHHLIEVRNNIVN